MPRPQFELKTIKVKDSACSNCVFYESTAFDEGACEATNSADASFNCFHDPSLTVIKLVCKLTNAEVDPYKLVDMYKTQYNKQVLDSGLVGSTIK